MFLKSKFQNLKEGNFNPPSVDFKIYEGTLDRDGLNFLTVILSRIRRKRLLSFLQ